MKSLVCSLTGIERLKRRIIMRSDELSCLYPLWHRLNVKKENCYFCDPDECCFLMLSAPHSFSAYPALEVKFLLAVRSLQKWRISQHFSLSLSVIRNRLCLLSFTKPKTEVCCLKFPPSFDGDFCPTYLPWWMCGPLSWQVCLNVSDRSQWKTGRKGKLPAPPPWLHLYLAWPVDGDVNLLWLHSRLDASPSIPASLLLLSVALAEEKEGSHPVWRVMPPIPGPLWRPWNCWSKTHD